MITKTLSPSALNVINQYMHFSLGSAVCAIPYFNNKTARMRIALRAYIGKGSPKDIHDEASAIMIKNHISIDSVADEGLKKLLVDNNIGIDCSGLAYYILSAESESLGKKTLGSHLSFTNRSGFLGKIRAKIRPVENCDVATLANDANSHIVNLGDIRPGDMITMVSDSERDHILVVHRVENADIYYTHAIAYAEDGLYGTGVRQGKIGLATEPLTGSMSDIFKAVWSENKIVERAKKSKTEIRRLKWF